MVTLIILLLAGLSSCAKIPVTGSPDIEGSLGVEGDFEETPYFGSDEVLFSEEIQLSKTALFGATPEPSECHLAVAGNPLDVSIPDGTVLNGGEHFVKIWRVRNTGSCAWTKDYSLTWFSGENIGTDEIFPFTYDVLPGEVVEIAVDMIAPQQAGVYQSNWKICDQDDTCFGLGAKGEFPFWAKIEVRERGTLTPSLQPSITPTSVVYASGRVTLSNGDQLDLDNEEIPADEDFDIILGEAQSAFVLVVLNQAEIAWFGQSIPTESQCQSLLYVNDSISLQDMDTSDVLCYKSNSGLTGYLKFNNIDLINGEMSIEYITWLTP